MNIKIIYSKKISSTEYLMFLINQEETSLMIIHKIIRVQ